MKLKIGIIGCGGIANAKHLLPFPIRSTGGNVASAI